MGSGGGGQGEVHEVEAAVIGAGAVGLAVAAAMAREGWAPLILEKNAAIGQESSSRNSEVIHAGLYYRPGSLKGQFCVEGRDRLYAWCGARGVPLQKLGKLIVATEPAEEPALERVQIMARGNGVTSLRELSGAEAIAMEPALRATAALWSPETGILDSGAYMRALLGAAQDQGAALALRAQVLRGGPAEGGGALLETADAESGAITRLKARRVVNAAGLWAQSVAARIEGLAETIPPTVLFKGSYFALSGAPAPFGRLVYPAPVPGGLGVHMTLDLGGQARFGPDVEPLETTDPAAIDYAVDPGRLEAFRAAIRRYWPGLPEDALAPAYAGVRAKIAPEYEADFRIDGPEIHGIEGLINLYGFESPALTGSLAIADHVIARLKAF